MEGLTSLNHQAGENVYGGATSEIGFQIDPRETSITVGKLGTSLAMQKFENTYLACERGN